VKIAIDTSPLDSLHAGRGIGTYTRLLIDSLKKYDVTNSYTTHVAEPDINVIHYPFFDLFFRTLPLIKQRPTVVTIHDVIPLVFSEAYPPGLRGLAKLLLQRLSLINACHIVTDSDCSTKDVMHYLQQSPKKVSTVYLAADEQFEPATKSEIQKTKNMFALKKPYFLYVGDINYNKNLPGLFEAFSKYVDDYDLVLVSTALKRDNPAAASLFNTIDRLHLDSSLKILSVPTGDMNAMKSLYSGCCWYIQPSFYEGFGLPVLEAQACGAPVISSLGGSLEEIVGNSAVRFDEGAGISYALGSDRDVFIEKSFHNCRRFSWEKTAQAMVEIYKQCTK